MNCRTNKTKNQKKKAQSNDQNVFVIQCNTKGLKALINDKSQERMRDIIFLKHYMYADLLFLKAEQEIFYKNHVCSLFMNKI